MTVSTRLSLKDGALSVLRTQDCEPFIENNKAIRNDPHRSESFHHIASIPNVLIEKWMNEEGAPVLSMPEHEFKRFIRKKLNDPDYAYLRTSSGRV